MEAASLAGASWQRECPVYSYVVFAHLVGAFGFLLAHGASVAITLRLPREHDARAIRVLLDLSAAMRGVMYGSLVLLLLGGITAGFMGDWWSRGWIWAALGILLLMLVAIMGVGVPYFRRLRQVAEASSAADAPTAELSTLLAAPQPWIVTGVGVGGLLVILWLMVLKPF